MNSTNPVILRRNVNRLYTDLPHPKCLTPLVTDLSVLNIFRELSPSTWRVGWKKLLEETKLVNSIAKKYFKLFCPLQYHVNLSACVR
jgi:hypothetical protein